jgi:pyruvate/2-oxoacid:ferredoxin oxidoreductase beta subunit
VPIVYIIENNGVYGLTKGQFSATADVGTRAKSGQVNEMMPIDLCEIAIQLGCGFVARSFSGDPKQLRPLLKAAFSHRGTSVLDVISPCVTFNNHEGSTKSYTNAKEHDAPLHEVSFIPHFENIEIDYSPGESRRSRSRRIEDRAEEARGGLRSDRPHAGHRHDRARPHREPISRRVFSTSRRGARPWARISASWTSRSRPCRSSACVPPREVLRRSWRAS